MINDAINHYGTGNVRLLGQLASTSKTVGKRISKGVRGSTLLYSLLYHVVDEIVELLHGGYEDALIG